MIYRDAGVVLRTYKLGEADRIIVVLTEGRGKVRAVAKGVRKTKSRFGGRLEPVSHVAMQLYEGRDLHTITQAETLDAFRPVREDLNRLTKATGLLEATDQVAQDGEANAPLYRMLVGALRALAAQDSPLLVAGYYFKLLSQSGFHPMVDRCATCGGEGPLVAFDLSEGGGLCGGCRRGIAVSPPAFDLVRRILGGGLAAALSEPPSPITAEVDQLATHAMESHLERRLRTSHLLDH